VHYLKKFKGFV